MQLTSFNASCELPNQLCIACSLGYHRQNSHGSMVYPSTFSSLFKLRTSLPMCTYLYLLRVPSTSINKVVYGNAIADGSNAVPTNTFSYRKSQLFFPWLQLDCYGHKSLRFRIPAAHQSIEFQFSYIPFTVLVKQFFESIFRQNRRYLYGERRLPRRIPLSGDDSRGNDGRRR